MFQEPTAEECTSSARVKNPINDRYAFACWYPQMGGYSSKCVVVLADVDSGDTLHLIDPCFDVYVWHDGEFPFSDDGERSPALLHHCSAQQFVAFATTVQRHASKA